MILSNLDNKYVWNSLSPTERKFLTDLKKAMEYVCSEPSTITFEKYKTETYYHTESGLIVKCSGDNKRVMSWIDTWVARQNLKSNSCDAWCSMYKLSLIEACPTKIKIMTDSQNVFDTCMSSM